MIKWISVDSSNIYHLLNLIKVFGFPSKSLVGENSNFNAEILFIHFDSDRLNLIIQPILDSAFKNKKIIPSTYAAIIDRHRDNFGTAPIYYEMYCKKYKLLTEEEQKKVIENRKIIGLNSGFCN